MTDADDARRARARRRRHLDAVFGDVLPTTADNGQGPRRGSGFDAEYYRVNRPPHHGD